MRVGELGRNVLAIPPLSRKAVRAGK